MRPAILTRTFRAAGLAFLFMIVVSLVGAFAHFGTYGINFLIQNGITYWITVGANDPRLSDGMRVALNGDPTAFPGPFEWRSVGTGFEVGELPVLVDGNEVDRIFLARIDPQHYRFVVRNAPDGNVFVHDWRERLNAALVINGSYYAHNGTPDTPFLSDGRLLGPSEYDAKQGAFVASDAGVSIHDLAHEDWHIAFRGADNALVSYPLLLGGDSAEHTIKPTSWLANRSFVGEDASGQIVLGTTHDAFFSLARLAAFLRASPLGLTRALNLDGGPVACQEIAVGAYNRSVCGNWELQENNGNLQLLRWLYGSWALPVVLAAVPR